MIHYQDLSFFKPYLHPRHTSDGIIQGIQAERLKQIFNTIHQAEEMGIHELQFDARGTDRPLLKKVLLIACPAVETVLFIGLILTISLRKAPTTKLRSYENCNAYSKNNIQAVALWPSLSPDENDDSIQGHYLRKTHFLFTTLLKTLEENKDVCLFDARGYDRKFIKQIITLILPPRSVLVLSSKVNSVMILSVKSTDTFHLFQKIQQFMEFKSFKSQPLIHSPSTSSIEEKMTPRITQENLKPTSTPPSSKPTQIHLRNNGGYFLETYLIHTMESKLFKKTDESSVIQFLNGVKDEYISDPALLDHLRLEFESLLINNELTKEDRLIIQNLLLEMQIDKKSTLIELLELLKQHSPFSLELLAKSSKGISLSILLKAIKESNLKDVFHSACARKEIQSKKFDVPRQYFKSKLSLSDIEYDQMIGSYWPNNVGAPLYHIWVNQRIILPHPTTSFLNADEEKRHLYFINLLTALGEASKKTFSRSFEDLYETLFSKKLFKLKHEETTLLTLLHAGSFSSLDYFDQYLKTVIFRFLPENHQIQALKDTAPTYTEFFFVDDECIILRSLEYALLDKNKNPLATFIVQARISIPLSNLEGYQLSLSIPVFQSQDLENIEQRIAFYETIQSLIAHAAHVK
jgi:hypothetical protein